MPGPVFIAGDHVTLHPVEDEDFDDIQRDMNDVRIRFPGGGPNGPEDSERVESFIEGFRDGDDVALLVRRGSEYAGLVTVEVNSQRRVGSLGLWITPQAQGSGVGREACELLFDWLFDQYGLHKVTARVFAFNDASLALVTSLGFTEEGVHRDERYANGEFHDAHYFGLLADEWRERE